MISAGSMTNQINRLREDALEDKAGSSTSSSLPRICDIVHKYIRAGTACQLDDTGVSQRGKAVTTCWIAVTK